MKNTNWQKWLCLLPVLLVAAGCQRGPTMHALPKRSVAWPTPALTLVWHGRGEAYRMRSGSWERTPPFDYDFTVVQRRYGQNWQSTKTMQRRHPAYDGSAGPRAQTYHFAINYVDGESAFAIESTLGNGHGTTDSEFREASMVIPAEISKYAPFNAYTIDQHYDYAGGELRETVTLVKQNEQRVTPWAKVEERATLFAPTEFASPPTRMRAAQTD